jgi:uncharacterized membrane protein YedE/YeeE
MSDKTHNEAPFWNPYLAGIFLGLVLLGSFVVMGNGLGGSGAANRVAIGAAHLVAPQAVENSAYMGPMVAPGQHILDDWLVWEVLGVFLGGALAAYSAGRMKLVLLRGPRATVLSRLALALIGGVIMGVAARLGRGCTSGQALTGGAALAAGSWVFMFAVFGGGYLVAPLLRRYWK